MLKTLNEVSNEVNLDTPQDIWVYKGRLYIPMKHRRTFNYKFHTSPLHNYQRIAKTYERFKRHFDFLRAKAAVTNVVKNCEVCAKSKALQYKPYREL